MELLDYFKIPCFPDNTVVAFDRVNSFLIISCSKSGRLLKYKFPKFSTYSYIKLEGKIRCLAISPFGDGLCLIGHGNEVSLLNLVSNEVIRSFLFEHSVSALSFCDTDRAHFFVADMSGSFYTCNIVSSIIAMDKVCNQNIHSIALADNNTVYAASTFNIFFKDLNVKGGSFEKLHLSAPTICTSITLSWGTLLAVFRDQNYRISQLYIGGKTVPLSLDIKQYSKHNDIVFNGYICITNDSKNTIEVLDLYTLTFIHSYTFEERIIGFCGDTEFLIVLTERRFYVYSDTIRPLYSDG